MVGCSEYTILKWERFAYLFDVEIGIIGGILSRMPGWADERFWYYDFYAGPGIYSEREAHYLAGRHGSPMIAVAMLRESRLNYRANLYDEKDETARRLQRAIDSHFPGSTVSIDTRSFRDAVDGLRPLPGEKKALGLAFIDPNGPPDWKALEDFCKSRRGDRTDVLINVNSSNMKLQYVSPKHAEHMRPTEHLKALGKRYIYLWEPAPSDMHQFALAFCTNCPESTFPDFPKKGFHKMSSEMGGVIARRIDMTHKERKAAAVKGQGVLFGGDQ